MRWDMNIFSILRRVLEGWRRGLSGAGTRQTMLRKKRTINRNASWSAED